MHEFALLPYYLTEFVSYGMAFGAVYLALRVVRAYERRTGEPARLAAVVERLQELEETVERVEGTLVHTLETQQFTTRVLLSRNLDERR